MLKSIKNIEIAKTQGKNSVVIEKKQNKFVKKSNTFRRYSLSGSLNLAFLNKAFRNKNTIYRQMILKDESLLNKEPLKDLKETVKAKIKNIKSWN